MDKSLDTFTQIPTKASRVISGESSKDVEEKFTVVFSKKKKKAPKSKETTTTLNKTEDPEGGFDIRRARHEVMRFGISGFDAKAKEDAKVTMAIKLGAKPPKREYKNYKDLQQERKKQAAAEADSGPLSLLKKSYPTHHQQQTRFGGKRKRQDEHNTIGAYGKVDKSQISSIKQPRKK